MKNKRKKPIKKVWSAIVSSLAEFEAAFLVRGLKSIPFPIILVPRGAETTGATCRLFRSLEEIWPPEEEVRGEYARQLLEEMLANAFPIDGVRTLHIISVNNPTSSSVWGWWLKKPEFTFDT